MVVGAGPTGLTAALELSRLGVPVRLIDQKTEPSTTSRALAIQGRTVELLHQRGLGSELLALGNPAHATTIYGDDKQLAKVNLREIPSRYNFILLLAQSETERLLRQHVARQGVAVEWGTELIGLEQVAADRHAGRSGAVRAVLRQPGEQLEELECAYLLSTEGAPSSVRHTLQLPFTGKSLPQRYALADLYLDGDSARNELSIFVTSKGLLAVFPIKNRHFHLISTTGPGAPTTGGPTLEEVQHLYDAVACRPARLRDMTWSARFTLLLTQGAAPPADWQAQLRPWQARLTVPRITSATGEFAAAFGRQPAVLLVRPDAYLGLVANPAGWPTLLAWLRRWLPAAAGQ